MHIVALRGGASLAKASLRPDSPSKGPTTRGGHATFFALRHRKSSNAASKPLRRGLLVLASGNQQVPGGRDHSRSPSPETSAGKRHSRGGNGAVEERTEDEASSASRSRSSSMPPLSETISSPSPSPSPTPRRRSSPSSPPVPRSSVTLSQTVRTVPGPPVPDGPTGQRMAATRARVLQQQQQQQQRKKSSTSSSTTTPSSSSKNNAVPFFPPTTTAAALLSSFRSPEDNDFYYSPSSLLLSRPDEEGGGGGEEERDQAKQQQQQHQQRRRRRRQSRKLSSVAVSPPPPQPPLAPLAATVRGFLASSSLIPLDAPPVALARKLWLLLPFRLRKLSWPLFGPPPLPPFHASPRAAALRAAVDRGGDGDGERALRALVDAKVVGRDGRATDAGADVPRHLLERLVGRGLRKKAAERVRAALTLPSALPRQKSSSASKVAEIWNSSSSSSSSGNSGSSSSSSSGSSGDEDESFSSESESSSSSPSSTSSTSSTSLPPQFERLEYLGDAVLELAAREWSLARFPRATEHGLSNSARSLVCGRSLLAAAAAARLDVFVTSNARSMSRGEYLTHWSGAGGLASLVDAVEAVAGALYLEFGLRGAAEWVLQLALDVSVAADDDNDEEFGEENAVERGEGKTVADSAAFENGGDDDNEEICEEVAAVSSSSSSLASSRLLLDNNYKSLLAIVAGHSSVEYRGSHARCESWGGHSPGHPATKGSAAIPAVVVSGEGREQNEREEKPEPHQSRAAWLWVSRVFVDGELQGVGADVHRPTAEQAAARQALAGAGVDADALWRERLRHEM